MLFLAFLYIGIQIPMIYTTAWASALLILGRWQYQSQVCGMSDVFRFPRFLFSSFYVCAGLGISGEKWIVTGVKTDGFMITYKGPYYFMFHGEKRSII